MKKFYNILLTIAALAAFASCAQEEIEYKPGEPDVEGCYGVYFPTQEAFGDHTLDPTKPTEVDITVARTNTKGSITVPVEATDPKGIYHLDPITFEDGQSETTLHISFSDAELGVKYPLSVKIADPQYASTYKEGATMFDYSVFRVEYKYLLNPKTNEPAKVTFTQDWWGETHTGKVKYYEVDGVRYCQTETDPFDYEGELGYGFFGCDASAASATEWTFVWYPNEKDEDGNQFVNIPVQFTGYISSSVGKVNVYDYFGYWTVLNPQAALAGLSFVDFCKKYGDSYPYSYYDGKGGFYFYTYVYCNEAGSGWKEDAYDIIGIAEGFTRTDYSVEIESDYCEDGAVPVEFKLGADVAKVDYTVLPGELTKGQIEKAVASLAEGEAENVATLTSEDFAFDEEEGFNYAYVDLELESETGDYTVVAITYDEEDEVQESASESFYFVAADDDSFDVDFNIIVEDTPARYESEGATALNSFKVTLWGSDLKDVKFAVYSKATIEKYGLDVIKEDLYEDEEDTYSLSEEAVEVVNSIDGLSFVVDGLGANTVYYAFAWATNGTKATYAYAGYKTSGLPNEILGEGHYDYYSTDVEGYDHEEEDLTLEFNPNDKYYLFQDYYYGCGEFDFATDKDWNIGYADGASYFGYLDLGDGYSALVVEGADAIPEEYMEECFGDGYSHYDEDTDTYYFRLYWLIVAGGSPVGECYGVDTFKPNAEGGAPAKTSSFSFDKMQKVSKGNVKNLDFKHFSISERYGSFNVESDFVRTVEFQSRTIAPREISHKTEITNVKNEIFSVR